MGLLLNFLLFALVFLLEGLVYLENLCYTVLWPSRRYRQHPRTTTLDKLILQKEDEIWHAAIYGKDGDVQKIFEDLTNRPGENGTSANISSECGAGFLPSNPGVPFASGKIEEGFLFHRPKIKLQAAIETNVAKTEFFNRGQGYETAVQARLENIADQLANSTRVLTEKESWKTIVWCHDPLPILWVAIKRCHWSDVDYLLTKRNLDLRMRYTFDKRTVLHEAVWCGNPVLVRDILKKSPSSSPKTYINVGDNTSETALHLLVYHSVYSVRNLDDLDKVLNMFTLLVENGADINALDESFMTPLHLLLSTVTRRSEYDHFLIPLLDSFILAGAEVNTKDIKGNSPLHLACKLRDYKAIEMLVRNGADTETLNRDGKSPRRVFTDCRVQDKDFWKRMTILSLQKQNISANLFAPSRKLPLSRSQNSKAEMALCDQSLIYCRYQRRGLVTKSSNPLHWSSTDKSVSDVLYSKNRPRDITFLAECEKECRYVWDEILEPSKVLDLNEQELEQRPTAGKFTSDKSRITLGEDLWRWVNFPANNITWVREFIEGNLDIDNITLKFLEKNMKACTTRNNTSRITEPHAHMMDKDAPKLSSHDRDKNSQTRSVVSLVIPFLDIEVTPAYPFTEISGDEAYSPFTGLDGVQMPETLDQTSIRAESQSKLRTKENQVIYRWSQKQNSAKIDQHPRNLEWRVHKPYSKLANLLRRIRRRIEIDDQEKAGDSSLGRMGQAGGSETADISTRARSILGDRRPKWLMVRQLWLWKLDDGTILTAIPSRENMCMADDLLETIQQSGLHEISDVDQLMKHILQETVAFPEKFKRAGLGEHILDVFESEIASEADEEATFYNNFAQNDWNSKHANKAISCTWRVKDIRDELQLIRNVFTSQLEVVNQFARGLASQLAQGPEDSDFIPRLRSKLGSMIQRIDSMDSEAAKTIESLNNITQAMLAQAALKEAESARLMNFIILPFTIVTVIFTPLSFMTSLFAVNSDGFPHNEDGELRIPSDWFWRRMVIGEFGTLIPLFIFVLFLYYWRRSPRSLSQEQPGR